MAHYAARPYPLVTVRCPVFGCRDRLFLSRGRVHHLHRGRCRLPEGLSLEARDDLEFLERMLYRRARSRGSELPTAENPATAEFEARKVSAPA